MQTHYLPQKVSYINTDIGKIKIIRRSVLCRVMQTKSIAIWNRVYVSTEYITPKMLRCELDILRRQRNHLIWKLAGRYLTI